MFLSNNGSKTTYCDILGEKNAASFQVTDLAVLSTRQMELSFEDKSSYTFAYVVVNGSGNHKSFSAVQITQAGRVIDTWAILIGVLVTALLMVVVGVLAYLIHNSKPSAEYQDYVNRGLIEPD